MMKTLSVVAAAMLLWMSHARPAAAQVYYPYTPANYYAAPYTPPNVQAVRYWYAGSAFKKGACASKATQKKGCAAQKSSCGCAAQKSSCSERRIVPAILGRVDAALKRLFECNTCGKGGCDAKVSKPKCGCGKKASKGGGRGRPLLSHLNRCKSCDSKGKSACGCRRLLGRRSDCDTQNVPMQMQMESDPFLDDSEPPRPVPSLDVPTPMPFSSRQQPSKVLSLPSVYQAVHNNTNASQESREVAPTAHLQTVSRPVRLTATPKTEEVKRANDQHVNPLRTYKSPAGHEIVNPLRD